MLFDNILKVSIRHLTAYAVRAHWLSGRVIDSRPRGRGVEPHQRHCVVSLSENINPSLVLVQPRKTPLFTTERLLFGHKESNQTKQTQLHMLPYILHWLPMEFPSGFPQALEIMEILENHQIKFHGWNWKKPE